MHLFISQIIFNEQKIVHLHTQKSKAYTDLNFSLSGRMCVFEHQDIQMWCQTEEAYYFLASDLQSSFQPCFQAVLVSEKNKKRKKWDNAIY